MRRLALARLALAAVAVAALAIPSSATPFTARFDDVLVEMNARDAVIPFTGGTKEERRQRAALNRAFRALAVESADLRGDLAMARRIAGALEKGFPGDGSFPALLGGMNGGLAADANAERDATVVLISIAKEGAIRARAEAKLAAADALFIAADEAATETLRARCREKGFRAVLRAAALAVKAGTGGNDDASTMSAVVGGQPWAANTDFGTGVSGLADVSGSTGGLRRMVVSGRRILPLSTDSRLPGETSRIQLTLTSANANIVPGLYTTGTSAGVNISATWFEEDESENVSQAVSTAALIEVTSMTVRAGSVDMAGTFTLTMYDGLADVSFEIATGAFEAVGIPRNTVP